MHALATAAGRYRVLVLTLGYCGLRWGEASALRVHNVDVERGRVDITDPWPRSTGTSCSGRRSRTRRGGSRCRRSCRTSCGRRSWGADRTTWSSPPHKGRCCDAELPAWLLRPGRKEAGLAGLVPHELRHTAASLAISAGATVKSVQRMLGHASATLTLDRYGHMFPGRARRGGRPTGRGGPPDRCVQNVY
ncbi:MAG TPA: tyrosine-type recombinase/integrase [Nocardioidaceae bacterium]|nr:tyrosine-type recombinase/integrase [Nocardioidaceae bacterium]